MFSRSEFHLSITIWILSKFCSIYNCTFLESFKHFDKSMFKFTNFFADNIPFIAILPGVRIWCLTLWSSIYDHKFFAKYVVWYLKLFISSIIWGSEVTKFLTITYKTIFTAFLWIALKLNYLLVVRVRWNKDWYRIMFVYFPVLFCTWISNLQCNFDFGPSESHLFFASDP